MDILMITLSLFGLGCLTVGTGAAVKDAVSNLSDRQDSKPNPIAVRYLKKFFKIKRTKELMTNKYSLMSAIS